jgi:Fe-S cluster assembly protein SufB
VAVDAVFDSVSVGTTFRKELAEGRRDLLPMSEAIREHPELVRKYLGSGGADRRQFLRGAQLGGVFRRLVRLCAPGVRCPMELSTYFRINARNTGQFERTLIIADKGATSAISKAAPRRSATRTSCTPPWSSWSRWTMPRSNIRRCRTGIRATPNGKGGIYNFVTKRGDCRGARSKISWTQVETGSAITWKYPSCILRGDNSRRRVLLGGDDATTASRPIPAPR